MAGKIKSARVALAVGLLGFTMQAHGQAGQTQTAATPEVRPAKKVLYFGKKGQLVHNPDSADHREELVYRDSVAGVARIYYPSGKLRRLVTYLHFERGIRHGVTSAFYETGEIKSRTEYQLNLPTGEALTYYRNGAVRSRTIRDAQLKPQTTYFTPEGTPRPAPDPKMEKMPSLGQGGYAEIVAFIQQKSRYPIAALRNGIGGKVIVSFTVDEAGFVRDVQIEKSPSPLLNAPVMEAVAALGRLQPGEEEGEPVEVNFTVPITFKVM